MFCFTRLSALVIWYELLDDGRAIIFVGYPCIAEGYHLVAHTVGEVILQREHLPHPRPALLIFQTDPNTTPFLVISHLAQQGAISSQDCFSILTYRRALYSIVILLIGS